MFTMFTQNRLLFMAGNEASEGQGVEGGKGSGASDSAVSCPELTDLQDKIRQQEDRITELEARTTLDMVGQDVARIGAYVEDVTDQAVSSLRDAVGRGSNALASRYESARSYVTGSVDQVVSSAEDALNSAKVAAEAELAELKADYEATVARVEAAVSDGWGGLLETGAVTLAEVQDAANWTKEQVLAVAQSAFEFGLRAQTLPAVFMEAVNAVENLTAQEAKALLEAVKGFGGDVDAFVDNLVKQGGDMISVAVNEVKGDYNRVVELAGVALADGTQTFYRVIDTVVGAGMEAGDLFGSLLEQGKMKVSDVARLAVEKKNYAVDAVRAVIVSGEQGVDSLVRAASQSAEQLKAVVSAGIESGGQAVGQFVESALLVGKNTALVVLGAVAAAGYGASEAISYAISKGRVGVQNFAWMVSYNAEYCQAVIKSTIEAGGTKFNEMTAAVMANKEQALAWLDGVETSGADQLKAFANYLGAQKDAAVAFGEYALASGEGTFFRVMDTLVGAGLDVKDMIAGLVGRGENELNAVLAWAGDNVERCQVAVQAAVEAGGKQLDAALVWAGENVERGKLVVKAAVDAGDEKLDQLMAAVGEQKDRLVFLAQSAVALGEKYAAKVAIGALMLANAGTIIVIGALVAAGYGINKVFEVAVNEARVASERLVAFVFEQKQYAVALANGAYKAGVTKFNEISDVAMQNGQEALAWFNTVKEAGKDKVNALAQNLKQKEQELATLAGESLAQGKEVFYTVTDTLVGAGLEVKDVMVALLNRADTQVDELVAYCAEKKEYMAGLAAATAAMGKEKAGQVIAAIDRQVEAKEAFVKATLRAGEDVIIANYEAAQAVGVDLGRRVERKYNAAKKEQERLEARGRAVRTGTDADQQPTSTDL